MKYFWQLSNFLTALYGGAVVGLSALLMHLWQGEISEQSVARLVSALSMLAFHCAALLIIGQKALPFKLNKLVAILWHVGLWFFVWTILAGVFSLPFYYSQLTPIGGQLLIAAWLLLAATAWRRS